MGQGNFSCVSLSCEVNAIETGTGQFEFTYEMSSFYLPARVKSSQHQISEISVSLQELNEPKFEICWRYMPEPLCDLLVE